MDYKFPEIRTINDVLPAIKDRKEFIVAEREGYVVVNYMVQTPETFGNPEESGKLVKNLYGTLYWPNKDDLIRRECRGIIFDENGDILSRPFHKFFNLGERMETQPNKLDFTLPHTRLLKLDGSMIRPIFFRKQNGFRLATKMGITDVAMQAEIHVSENLKYFAFFRKCNAAGLSPSFEWVSPKNRIVIDYTEQNLILTAIRETISGEYLTFREMDILAKEFDIPVVDFVPNDVSFDEFLNIAKAKEDVEGFVVRFDNGHMLKVKTDLYVRMHKSKDIVSSDRRIIELILTEKIDDIKPMLMEGDIGRVEDLERKVVENIELLSNRLLGQATRFRGMDKKEFAIQHSNELQPFFRKAMFKILEDDNTNTFELAKSFIADNSKADNRFDAFQKEYDLNF